MALKRLAAQPADHKPRFDWRHVAKAAAEVSQGLPIRVKGHQGMRDLRHGDIADTVGSAVTDLCLSQNRDDIFSESNRSLVARVTGAVVGQQPFGGGRASGTNDKAGSALNLLRWVSPRSIKETFVAPTAVPYPFQQEP